jgi:cytochrome P450
MKTFVLCMLLNPSVQQKAQAEIDKVVGRDRLPTLADRPNLPYLDACLKESSRWAPVAPEALPHRARVDAEYEGYFIPAGTIMIPNVWSVTVSRALMSLYPNLSLIILQGFHAQSRDVYGPSHIPARTFPRREPRT